MSAVSWGLTVPSPHSRSHTGATTWRSNKHTHAAPCSKKIHPHARMHSFSRSVAVEGQLTVRSPHSRSPIHMRAKTEFENQTGTHCNHKP